MSTRLRNNLSTGTGVVKRAGGQGAVTTEVPALALVSSRVASAIKKILSDQELDAQDLQDLRSAREELIKNSDPSSNFLRAPARHAQSRRLIVSTVQATSRSGEAGALGDRLKALADDLERGINGVQLKDGQALLRYYEQLAAAARRQSRGRSETIIRSR